MRRISIGLQTDAVRRTNQIHRDLLGSFRHTMRRISIGLQTDAVRRTNQIHRDLQKAPSCVFSLCLVFPRIYWGCHKRRYFHWVNSMYRLLFQRKSSDCIDVLRV